LSPVLLRLDDRSSLEDLLGHFVRSGFQVDRVDHYIIDVRQPGAPDVVRERDAISDHLAVWQAMNPSGLVTVNERVGRPTVCTRLAVVGRPLLEQDA